MSDAKAPQARETTSLREPLRNENDYALMGMDDGVGDSEATDDFCPEDQPGGGQTPVARSGKPDEDVGERMAGSILNAVPLDE